MSQGKKETTDLAVKYAGGGVPAEQLDAELQALLTEGGAEGLENVSSDDIIVPRLAILQPTSPLSTEDGYSSGHIVNLTTSENFGKEVAIIPLFFWLSRTWWASPDLNSDILCRSIDGRLGTNKGAATCGGVCASCPNKTWANDERPKCTEFKNLLVLPFKHVEGQPLLEALSSASPAIFSAKRASIRSMNEFLTSAKMLRIGGKEAALYSSVYKIKTEKNDGEKGTYFTPKFTRLGFVDTAATYTFLKETYTAMKAVQSRIAATPDEGEGDVIEGTATFSGDELEDI